MRLIFGIILMRATIWVSSPNDEPPARYHYCRYDYDADDTIKRVPREHRCHDSHMPAEDDDGRFDFEV